MKKKYLMLILVVLFFILNNNIAELAQCCKYYIVSGLLFTIVFGVIPQLRTHSRKDGEKHD